jgi:hypothetical protein
VRRLVAAFNSLVLPHTGSLLPEWARRACSQHWYLLKTAASRRCLARTRFPERRPVAALQMGASGLESGQLEQKQCGIGRDARAPEASGPLLEYLPNFAIVRAG